MIKKIHSFLSCLLITAVIATSCTKDKPLRSEAGEVLTTTDGDTYAVDTLNSRVEWRGYKVLKTDNTSHFGTIKFESGDVTMKDNELESGKFVADMGSLTSEDLKDKPADLVKLNTHLKSTDFFETEKFPTASYEITNIKHNSTGDYNTTLDGNLTIKGITKPVQLNANVALKNGTVSIATEPKDISRADFGVKFQSPAANGVIKDEVTIQMNVKALEKK